MLSLLLFVVQNKTFFNKKWKLQFRY